jgi:hypothetical protein
MIEPNASPAQIDALAQTTLRYISEPAGGNSLDTFTRGAPVIAEAVACGWRDEERARYELMLAAASAGLTRDPGEGALNAILDAAFRPDDLPFGGEPEAPAQPVISGVHRIQQESWQRIMRGAVAGKEMLVFQNLANEALSAADKPGALPWPDMIDWLHDLAENNGIDPGEVEAAADRFRRLPDDDASNPGSSDGPADPWNDPDWSLLDDRRGELPDFPLSVLSPRWQEWAQLAAHGAGVTAGHVVVPLIAVASSLIGSARRVQASTSFIQPFTCWTAIVGNSGSGKTPGIAVVQRHLAHIEGEREPQISEARLDHETRRETARAAVKAWKKDLEAAQAEGRDPPKCPQVDDMGEFVAPRLFVRDATVERLAVLLTARPRGALVIVDELAGHFLNMGRYSNGSDREFWLESWNGDRFSVERMGRPPVNVRHLLIGVTGGLQPDKLARSFEGDADGMYARVCFAWPQEPPYRPLTNDVRELEPDVINALARLVDIRDSEDGRFYSRAVPVASGGGALFEQFRQFVHTGKEALEGREREWWAKGPAQVLRIAGTLAYLAWSIEGGPEPETIEAEHMAAAIELWRGYFWPHSRAALRQIGLTERHVSARKVLRWIRANDRREVSVKDARREALAQSLDAKQTETLLDSLTASGWLKRKPAEKTGGRPVVRWLVNDALFMAAESAASAESPQARGGNPLSALSAGHGETGRAA